MSYELRMTKTLLIILFLFLSAVLTAQEIKKVKITDLEKTIAESKTPLIVNFWATFCIPCIKEIPYFQKLVKRHQKDSIKLLLVSVDLQEDYSNIKSFAAKRKFTAPIVWLDETNADYFCPRVDSSWSGAIPASLFVNNKTGYRKFLEQELSEVQLEKEIMAILKKKG
jgi:thiol-disulfide isomerase/thioredoxin